MRVTLGQAFAELARDLRSKKAPEGNPEQAWRSGDLSYKLWDVQKRMAAILLKKTGSLKKVLNCSRRIRKTTTALVAAIETVGLVKSNGLIRFGAPTRDMIETIIIPIMDLICEDAPEDLKPSWVVGGHHYHFPSTGAKLYVAGCDNLRSIGRLRGRAADLCVVDEAQEIVHLKYLVDDVMMPQLLGVEGARGPLWILLTPPKTPVHECRDYVIEAQATGDYGEFDIYESEYPAEVIEKFKAEAGGEESTTWQREYLCQFVVDKNFSIVPEWKDSSIQEYVPDEFFKFYGKYEGLDIGVRHKTVNLYAVYDFLKAKLFVQDETVLSGPQMTTDKLAEAVKKREVDLWGDFKPQLRIADNSNLVLLQDLSLLHQLHYAPTSKDTLEAMVNNMRLWVGAGKLVVSPRCEQLIGCLKYGVWDNARKDWEESKVFGHFDALAALMYMVRNIDIVTNPIPRTYGTNEAEMFVRDSMKNDQGATAEALRKAFNLNGRRRQ